MDITKVCDDITELDQDTQAAVAEFMRICKEKGLPIRIFETYRPQARQDYLYAQGRTRPGNKVTWTLNSFHTTRRAFDVIHKDLLWNAPESFWKAIAEIGKSIGLNAGYYWNKQDKPHFQLDKGKKPIVKGADEMAKATEKEKGYGKMAIENLSKNKIINSPESHLQDLDGYMPSWKVWVVLNNIYEALKGDK